MDKKMMFRVLHYGSLWGIAEATLGYALHALPLFSAMKIAGSIMFPIGVLCMFLAFKKTDKVQAILWTAIVAAVVKSINFIIPNAYVINPIMAILAEGLAVFLILPIMLGSAKPNLTVLFSMGFAVSAAWRVPFLYLPYRLGWKGIWETPPERWVPFLTTDVFFNALFIAGFVFLAIRYPLSSKLSSSYERIAFAPSGAFTALILAFSLEYLIR